MSDDLLDSATEAFRQETAGVSHDAAAIGRILSSIEKQKGQRHSRLRIARLAAVAVVLVGSLSMALPSVRAVLISFSGTVAAWVRPVRTIQIVSLPPLSAPSTPPKVNDDLVAPASPQSMHPKNTNLRGSRVPAPSPTTAGAPSQEKEVQGSELQLFETALRVQFEAKKPAEAARLWEQYLLKFPATGMAVEARYNWGWSLWLSCELSASAEVLAPFLRGEFGAMRKGQAETLLAKPSPPEACTR